MKVYARAARALRLLEGRLSLNDSDAVMEQEKT